MHLVFRNGVEIDDPLRYALAFLQNDYSYRSYDRVQVATDTTITLDDIRVANRIGARMSAAESEALLARKAGFEAALARIPSRASLCDADDSVPWEPLGDLYAAANGVRGVGLAKLTKFLHKKRPELIPMLDSVVEGYLRSVSEIPLRGLGFGAVGTALTRSYKVDLDENLAVLREVKTALADHGYELSECRILDLFTWAYSGDTTPPWAARLGPNLRAPEAVAAEATELALDVGITLDDENREALEAVVARMGYERARRVLGGWRQEERTGASETTVCVAGVDGTKDGWVAVELVDGGFARADVLRPIETQFAELTDAQVIAIDVPIGFGPREADTAARRYLGRAASTVFTTPTRELLEGAFGPGLGISAQSHALGPRILHVTALAVTNPRMREVHPEVSFRVMNDGVPLSYRKKSAGGMLERLELLRRHGIELGDLGEAATCPVDDVLDAAAAAWSAHRIAVGNALSFPDPPELISGRSVAIWY